MNQENKLLYKQLIYRLENELNTLDDKPEENPESTIRVLWFMACGDARSTFLAEKGKLPDLKQEQGVNLEGLVEKRISGIPLSHLSKRQNFMGLELLSGPEALVPRKETELLGYAALEKLKQCAKKIETPLVIDVCTGAGNIAMALAENVGSAMVYASDLSQDAVNLAEKNAKFCGIQGHVKTQVSDLFEVYDNDKFYRKVDLLTCNPPYISSAKVVKMNHEISKHEPNLAFDGGPFGVKIILQLIEDAPRYLKKGGWLAFEVGLGQGKAMIQSVKRNKAYLQIETIKDEKSNIRVVLAKI